MGDFYGLAKEADCVLLTSRHLSIYRVVLDTLQPAADNEDPVMGLEFSPVGDGATCDSFLCGRKAQRYISPCTLEVRENAKVSAQ